MKKNASRQKITKSIDRQGQRQRASERPRREMSNQFEGLSTLRAAERKAQPVSERSKATAAYLSKYTEGNERESNRRDGEETGGGGGDDDDASTSTTTTTTLTMFLFFSQPRRRRRLRCRRRRGGLRRHQEIQKGKEGEEGEEEGGEER